MQAADQVKILEVHKKTVVKENVVFRKHGKPHEHKAARKARRVHHAAVARILEAVACVLLLLPLFQETHGRHKASENQIAGRGKQLAQILHRSVGIDDFRQHVARTGMLLHKISKERKHFRTEANVRVQDDVIDASAFNRLPHRKVVARSIAEVRVVDVADGRKILLQNPPSVVRRVVDDVQRPNAAGVRNRLHHRLNLGARRVEQNDACGGHEANSIKKSDFLL